MDTSKLIWRVLSAEELERVYIDEMRRDFPTGELKPLSVILTSTASGAAHAWGVYDGYTLAAYLLMVRPEGCALSQLDYFAVLPAYRDCGLGAKLLAELPAREKDARAIIIEAECPEFAPDMDIAARRLGFYARCGCIDTGWQEMLYDVHFRVLVLNCGEPTMGMEQIVKELADCYRRTLGEAGFKKYVRFYNPSGTQERIS